LFQVDGEGYLDAEKTKTFVKADDQWGPILADKDSLISRCVAFGNKFSKGEFLYSILYFRLNGPMTGFSRTEYTLCPFLRVPKQGRFITKEACIRRNIPVTDAVPRDTIKRTLVLYNKLLNSQLYADSIPIFAQYTRRAMNPLSWFVSTKHFSSDAINP